jgi:hypothetical protein
MPSKRKARRKRHYAAEIANEDVRNIIMRMGFRT